MSKSDKEYLRRMKSHRYFEELLPEEFIEFADSECLPRLGLKGYKLEEKRRTARHVLHNLIRYGLWNQTVADPRDNSKAPRPRIEVWSAVVEAGMARQATGSEKSGRVTLYFPTNWLLERRELWRLGLLRHTAYDSGALVVLRTGKKDWISGKKLPKEEQDQPVSIRERVELCAQPDPKSGRPYPEAIENGLSFWREMEERIEKINHNNLLHGWMVPKQKESVDGTTRLTSGPLSVALRQIHSGLLFRGMRLYTWGPMGAQNLPKELRPSMLIDGEPVAELDFSALHVGMLYHFNNTEGPEGDRYKPEQIFPRFYSFKNVPEERRKLVRKLVKRATNACWNTDSISKAENAVHKLFRNAPRDLRNIVYNTEKTNPRDLLQRIEEAHPALVKRGCFYCDVGEDLMATDGKMMLQILLHFADAGKPALGIHDSLVVKRTDADWAEDVMEKVYLRFMRHKPRIHRVI